MKTFLNLCCAVSFAWVVVIAAETFHLVLPQPSREKPAQESVSSQATVFGSHVRSKVVQYFDTYRSEPHGLPPGFAVAVHRNGESPAWETQELARGAEVHTGERHALVETPVEIRRILPSRQPDVRYYLAGSHLVAVDSDYKVVDFIRIPTVRFAESAP